MKKLPSSLFILIGLLCFIMFGMMSWGVHIEISWLQSLDLAIIEAVQSNITTSKTAILSTLTEIGNIRLVIGLTIILVLFLFFKKWYATGLWLGGTILFGAAILTKIIKKVVDRERPDILPLMEKTTESFPSGHATAATVFYGIIGLAIILLMRGLWKRIVIGFITLGLIGFILVTRIYLGVHYPTDVIAGFLYGASVVFVSFGVYCKLSLLLRHVLERFGLADQSELFSEDSVLEQRS
ncbi:phosphatase PAP2 family protein [Oceanobacillus luteolus]|uniref:Phosphatase PAP2 family protein n=1 Tax=Oceanobacillus luteolus TaxID=1274358 RepID=A0ABW4HWQ6_9BACI|nr:phosphatase PAP2 family protein [Oceanobacillus luteolus]MCM3742309.1 phosphatase PAP2 family protein [Oceanobacillus luteolus]